MIDTYYVYRPLIDLIGLSEGTDKGDGYNETLAYGAYTGGDVNLVSMSLAEIDKLQTSMLKHPKNKWNSSAAGRYQIVRTTLRTIKKTLLLNNASLFDSVMQDRMACYLLGMRGIDKWLSGRLSIDTLLNNLAHEWASLPMPNGKGAYGGQHAAVSVAQVKTTLEAVKARHKSGQPKQIEIPDEIDKKIAKKSSWWKNITGGLFSAGGVGSFFVGADFQTVAIILLAGVIVIAGIVIFHKQVIKAIKEVRESVA